MFSGKSEELIRRLRRAQIAKQKVAIFKPKVDDRYSKDEIVSHSAAKIASKVVSHSSEILEQSRHADVVGIDEAQFLMKELLKCVINSLMMASASLLPGLIWIIAESLSDRCRFCSRSPMKS
jgi:thymidine kinase